MLEGESTIESEAFKAAEIASGLTDKILEAHERLDFGDEFLQKCDQEGVAVESVIEKLVGQGFIFHGSDRRIEKLEPRRGHDMRRASGRLEAVYATDQPSIAIFRSIISRKRARDLKPSGGLGTSWSLDGSDKKFTASPAFKETLGEGYVHIFPKSDFKPVLGRDRDIKNPVEFITRKEVAPAAIIKVRPEDFLYEIGEFEE